MRKPVPPRPATDPRERLKTTAHQYGEAVRVCSTDLQPVRKARLALEKAAREFAAAFAGRAKQ